MQYALNEIKSKKKTGVVAKRRLKKRVVEIVSIDDNGNIITRKVSKDPISAEEEL